MGRAGTPSSMATAGTAARAPSAPPASERAEDGPRDTSGSLKPGVGLPFLRLVTGDMVNFMRVRKEWTINDRLSAQLGADYKLQGRHFTPCMELGCKINDRFGCLVLRAKENESKAVLRKEFKAQLSAVSMKVRCEAGCSLRGKPLFPKVDLDDPKPLKLFLGAAALMVACQKPLPASKVVPVVEAPIPFSKGKKGKAGVGIKLELQIRQRALCLSVHELSSVLTV